MNKSRGINYQILLSLSLMLPIVSCSDWEYNHSTKKPFDSLRSVRNDKNKRWDTQGFTLEEYKIYTQAGMNNEESSITNFNSALPWKKANIPATQAVKAHQEWRAANIDEDTAIYFTKNNITLSEYQEASNILQNVEGVNNTIENELYIIQSIKSGSTPAEAVDQLVKAHKEKEKEIWGEEIYKICNGAPQEMPFDWLMTTSPYSVVGKCYIFPYRLYPMQWISRNQILNRAPSVISDNTPYSSPSDIISYIEGNEEIEPNSRVAVIGIEPKTYETVLGSKNTVRSFHILATLQ